MSSGRSISMLAAFALAVPPLGWATAEGAAPTALLPAMAMAVAVAPVNGDEDLEAGAGAAVGHAEEGEAESPLAIRLDLALWSLVVFVVLLAVLRAFAWGPLIAGLDTRESRIRQDIAAAEQAREKAARLLAEHESRLKAVEAEMRDMRSEARAQGEKMRADAVAAGKEEAAALVEKARGEIEQDRRQAEMQLKAELAGMVVAAAEQVIGRKLNDGDERRLADEALQQFATSVN